MRDDVRPCRDYLRTRGGEAEMPEMWEQESLGRAGSCQRGDIQKELSANWFILSRTPGRIAVGHYRFVIGILRGLLTASGRLGIRTLKTPLSKLAATLSSSTVSGRRSERWKLP